MKRLRQEDINAFVEFQLANWPLAKKNYDDLQQCRRRKFKIGDLEGAWQYNPKRISSTGADLSKQALAARPCFLCRQNRPKEQISIPILKNWELLVNPYPIFPIHFTIVSTAHEPQDRIPLDMVSLAEMMEGMTIFFNGAKAGASAPDHSHLQGVLTSEMPLMGLVEEKHPSERLGILNNKDLALDLPFTIESAVIAPNAQGMADMAKMISDTAEGKVNFYCFIDRKGYLRMVRVPRQNHRPTCYFAQGEQQFMISPGSIDMAGIIITPRLEDFERITTEKTVEIYRETGKPAQVSPGA